MLIFKLANFFCKNRSFFLNEDFGTVFLLDFLHGFRWNYQIVAKKWKLFCHYECDIEKKLYFCKKLVIMPSTELKEKLKNLTRKVETLRKRYLALQSENREMNRTLECQAIEIEKLEKEVAQLKIDNEFLRVAHTVPRDPETVAKYKKQVAKMVRDIDRCIKQLNA